MSMCITPAESSNFHMVQLPWGLSHETSRHAIVGGIWACHRCETLSVIQNTPP